MTLGNLSVSNASMQAPGARGGLSLGARADCGVDNAWGVLATAKDAPHQWGRTAANGSIVAIGNVCFGALKVGGSPRQPV